MSIISQMTLRMLVLQNRNQLGGGGYNGNGYKRQNNIYSRILEYGWNNIEHHILKTGLSLSEAQQLETSLVNVFSECNKCLNIAKPGGAGGNPWVEIEYNGAKYSANDLAEKFASPGITGHDITTRLGRGWDVQTAIEQEKEERHYTVDYDGKSYTISQLLDLCSVQNMKARTLYNRIFVYGWDIGRALTQPMDTKKQPFGTGERKYFYNGEYYNSYELTQISSVKGLTTSHITTRIDHHGWSVEQAITKPIKQRNVEYEYDGKMYNTSELAQLSPDETMTKHDITDRIRYGWSVKDAVEIPKGQGGRSILKKKNNKERN